MQVAVTNGLLTPSVSSSEVTANCHTGNCTFADYSSLAVCSSVDDVTSTIIAHCPKGVPSTEAGCSYTVPQLQQSPTPRQDNLSTDQGGAALWIGASNAIPKGYPSGPETLVEFYVLYFPNVTILTLDNNANVTASLVALKGTLNLCVKTYHTALTNGETSTNVTNNQTNLNWQLVSQVQNTTDITTVSATDATGL